MIAQFDSGNFHPLCDSLAAQDKDFRAIIRNFGYPPMWTRPNTFQTLVLTILEQQVSLASAYAAFKRLRERIGYVTPDKIICLTDEELRGCYFSRQKIGYVRALADAIRSGRVRLRRLNACPDDVVREQLSAIKGIGNWTVDVYLMHALRRTDLFPLGDIALVNSLKHIKGLPAHTTHEEMLAIAVPWRPYRTIAAMILWHAYIRRKGIRLET